MFLKLPSLSALSLAASSSNAAKISAMIGRTMEWMFEEVEFNDKHGLLHMSRRVGNQFSKRQIQKGREQTKNDEERLSGCLRKTGIIAQSRNSPSGALSEPAINPWRWGAIIVRLERLDFD